MGWKDKHNLLYRENTGKDRASRAVAPSEKHFISYCFLILFHLSCLLLYSLCFTCISYICNVGFFGALILHPLPSPLHIYTVLILLQITHSCTYPPSSFIHVYSQISAEGKEKKQKYSTQPQDIHRNVIYVSNVSKLTFTCKCLVLNALNCTEKH